MKINRVIETDVVVIGGGGSALRAAIEAHTAGARVIVVSKGKIGQSGATISPDSKGVAWQMADECSTADDSPEAHTQNIIDAGLGMATPELAAILAEEIVERSTELESLGMRFIPDPKNPNRHYTGYSCFGDRPRAHGIYDSGAGHAGDVVKVLTKRLIACGVVIHEDVFVSDLLVSQNECLGALAFEADGSAVVYRSGAVVLGTGGASQIFPTDPGRTSIDTTGDGYAMGYRAGAELTNMEFMQYMLHRVQPFGVDTPGVFWVLTPKVINSHGQSVLDQYLPTSVSPEQVMHDRTLHFPFSTRDNSKWLDIAIASEILAGRGHDDGSITLDFSEVDIRSFRPSRPQHMPQDFTAKPVISGTSQRMRISAHAVNGGVLIDKHSSTSVAGLFAAGETAAGPHGADRLGGAMVSGGQVFGARAGKSAAEFAKGVGVSRQAQSSVEHVRARIAAHEIHGNVPPERLRRNLQNLMQRYMLVVRHEHDLKVLISRLQELKSEMLPRASVTDPSSFRQALEIENLVETATLMATAALARRESRGGHFRVDFPGLGDDRWEVNLVLNKSNDGLQVQERRIGKR